MRDKNEKEGENESKAKGEASKPALQQQKWIRKKRKRLTKTSLTRLECLGKWGDNADIKPRQLRICDSPVVQRLHNGTGAAFHELPCLGDRALEQVFQNRVVHSVWVVGLSLRDLVHPLLRSLCTNLLHHLADQHLAPVHKRRRHVPHHHRRRRLLRHRVVAQRRDRPRLPRRKQAAHVPQHRPEDRVLLQRRTPDVAHQRRRRAHRHRHVEHPGHRVLHRPHVHRQQRSLLLVPVAHADRVEAQAHPVPAQVVHHPVQRTRVLHNLLHVRRVHREHLAAAVQRSQEPTQVAVRCRHTLPPCQVARLRLLLRVHHATVERTTRVGASTRPLHRCDCP
eukprot:Rhum_TRINITY_DN15476_c1_g1::Rhum_TRINITY_DN15476_c1_g1_i11::g.160099::m.160099